jgi:DNA-binding MarR family transcriptional regulator
MMKKKNLIKHPVSKSIGWTLTQAARLHRSRMGDKLSEFGLFAGQEQAIQALAALGAATMGDLAEILRVRPPTTSKTIARLSAQGLVKRLTEPGDARIVRVGLTEEGQAKAMALQEVWEDVEKELLHNFDGKEHKKLRKFLRRIAGNLAEVSGFDAKSFEGQEEHEKDEQDILERDNDTTLNHTA